VLLAVNESPQAFVQCIASLACFGSVFRRYPWNRDSTEAGAVSGLHHFNVLRFVQGLEQVGLRHGGTACQIAFAGDLHELGLGQGGELISVHDTSLN
jgi:hypothetical protein